MPDKPPAAKRRRALDTLTRDRLAALTAHFDLEVADRRISQNHVDAIVRSRRVVFADVLARLKRPELKDMCEALGLDTKGRDKQSLIDRILGLGPSDGAPQGELFDSVGEPPRSPTADAQAAAIAAKREPKRGKRKRRGSKDKADDKRASLGFEDKLWHAADLLRNNMDPAEYKHVVLGLIFLKYISDAFDERRAALTAMVSDLDSEEYIEDPDERAEELADLLEDRDEYTAENVFWVPAEARWSALQSQAKLADIGKRLDDAMDAIERDNLTLKGALPKIYALPNLDRQTLAKLIDTISDIGLGEREHRAKDMLGRVYEYFLSRFASAEGKGGGEFYTPTSVVRLLVAMIEPYRGRVYDPCCGSGGMFVQSLKFIEAHNGRRDAVTVYGQESNRTTWRMARMNLAIRGIEANLGRKHADSFSEDLHPDLRADYVLANPPFNVSVWNRREDDVRWAHGVPPRGNANFAWVQHFVHHLAPQGVAGFVLANGSMSSMQSGEGEIRRKLVEAELVDCIVACPGQLFYATQIPVCLWFLRKGRRARRGHVLFIDARKLGRMEARVHRVLDHADVERIATMYHDWRDGKASYADVPGLCKAVSAAQIAKHEFVLTPGRYVGTALVSEDVERFELRMSRLIEELRQQKDRAATLDSTIAKTLGSIGYVV